MIFVCSEIKDERSYTDFVPDSAAGMDSGRFFANSLLRFQIFEILSRPFFVSGNTV